MSHPTWKKRERQAARFFGSERNPLSGANSRHSGSDSLHETLFIEHKHRKSSAAVNLWDATKNKASHEKKIPVVTLSVAGRMGFWVVCHSSDLIAIANQRSIALKNGVE